MKILPIKDYTNQQQKPNFKGYFKYLGGCWGSNCITDEKPTYPVGGDCSDDIQRIVRYKINPFATVQRTVEDFHSVYTGKIYFADPLEYVTNEKRMEADYIVYDNEPQYPDVHQEVSRSYFGTDETDYSKQFEVIRNYYNRLEASDRATAEEYRNKILAGVDVEQSKEKLDFYNSRIQDSQYQQWQAQRCLDIYNQGYDLRMLKGKNEFDLHHNLYSSKSSYERDIKYAKSTIKDFSKHVADSQKVIGIFNHRISLYKQIGQLPKEIKNEHNLKWDDGPSYCTDFLDLQLMPDENVELGKKITQLSGFIAKYSACIKLYESRIAEAKQKLIDLPSRLEDVKQKIKEKENLIADIKAQLIPHFDELKNFYAKQGIKR